MNRLKRTGLLLLVFTLVVSMWGCASHASPQDTTENESAAQTTEVTVPEITVDFEEVTDPDVDMTISLQPVLPQPGIVSGTDVPTAQLRIQTTNSGWQNGFNRENGCFAVVSGVKELKDLAADKLSAFDLDFSAYDEAFFAENRLVLIPRSSNSGSVTYQGKLKVDGESVHIELDAHMPEMGTMDMAQWLVLVALPNAEYGDLTVTVPEAGGLTGNQAKK